MINKELFFTFNSKLGIMVPSFTKDWEEYNREEQIYVIQEWEIERSKIPDRIKQIEAKILETQEKMFEMTFEEYCEVHEKIVEMAGAINDLNILFRTQGDLTK